MFGKKYFNLKFDAKKPTSKNSIRYLSFVQLFDLSFFVATKSATHLVFRDIILRLFRIII